MLQFDIVEFNLKHHIIPWPNGCGFDVVFFGKNMTSMLLNLISLLWEGVVFST